MMDIPTGVGDSMASDTDAVLQLGGTRRDTPITHEFRLHAAVVELLTLLSIPTDNASDVASTLIASIPPSHYGNHSSSPTSPSTPKQFPPPPPSSSSTSAMMHGTGAVHSMQATFDALHSMLARIDQKTTDNDGNANEGSIKDDDRHVKDRKERALKLFERLHKEQAPELYPFVHFVQKFVLATTDDDDDDTKRLLLSRTSTSATASASPSAAAATGKASLTKGKEIGSVGGGTPSQHHQVGGHPQNASSSSDSTSKHIATTPPTFTSASIQPAATASKNADIQQQQQHQMSNNNNNNSAKSERTSFLAGFDRYKSLDNMMAPPNTTSSSSAPKPSTTSSLSKPASASSSSTSFLKTLAKAKSVHTMDSTPASSSSASSPYSTTTTAAAGATFNTTMLNTTMDTTTLLNTPSSNVTSASYSTAHYHHQHNTTTTASGMHTPLRSSRSSSAMNLLSQQGAASGAAGRSLRDLKQRPSMSRLNLDEKLKNLQSPLTPRPPKTISHPTAKIVRGSGGNNTAAVTPIGKYTLQQQEILILEDLCYVLLGIEGTYIHFTHPFPPPPTYPLSASTVASAFAIDSSLDPSLSTLLKRLLPLTITYTHLQNFINTHTAFESGKVLHALCGALRSLLNDYTNLVSQIEYQLRFFGGGNGGGFGVGKVWVHLERCLRVFEVLGGVVGDLSVTSIAGGTSGSLEDVVGGDVGEVGEGEGMRGGVVLGVLAEKVVMMSGDPTAHQLLSHLLSLSSTPYFATLRAWLTTGTLTDPFSEFFITERKNLTKDSLGTQFHDLYWEQKYTVLEERCPSFLRPWSSKVLEVGKWWGVVRECGGYIPESVPLPTDHEEEGDRVGLGGFLAVENKKEEDKALFGEVIRLVDHGGRFIKDIETAHSDSNSQLLKLLFVEKKLVQRLRVLKRLFLMEGAGDLLTHFLDLGWEELHKRREEVSVSKLKSLLELVVRSRGLGLASENGGAGGIEEEWLEGLGVGMGTQGLLDVLLRVVGVSGDQAQPTQGARQPLNFNSSVFREDGETHAAAASTQSPEGLKGIDVLMWTYNVPFPESLVLNKKVLTKYQLLFRHLVGVKNVERLLGGGWVEGMKARAPGTASAPLMGKTVGGRKVGGGGLGAARRVKVERNVEEEQFLKRMSLLRSRMLHFIQNLLHFCCLEVIEPNWAKMESLLGKAETLDQVLQVHHDFLDTCLGDCMLTNGRLLKLLGKVMSVCVNFTTFSTSYFKSRASSSTTSTSAGTPTSGRTQADQDYDSFPTTSFTYTTLASHAQPLYPPQTFATHHSASEHLAKLEKEQGQSTRALLNALLFAGASGESRLFGDLVARVDFNGYYTLRGFSGFEKMGGMGGWSKAGLRVGVGMGEGISGEMEEVVGGVRNLLRGF
ncbi:Gamma-tubulin complex component 2 [Chytridiales sp. JEL 0842]|nr:Gamma-tubulin complex component 2 [Chytridiales sp. JEL 0842]